MTRMYKPSKPTPLKKLLFRISAQNKKQPLAEAVKAYFRARGQRPRRYIEGKELQTMLKEIFVLNNVKFDTSTGTITMDVKERYFDDRVAAYKKALEDYNKSRKSRPRSGSIATRTPKRRGPRAEKMYIAGVKREQGWLYYLDKNCNVARSPMVRGGQRKRAGDKPTVIVKTDIKREDGYLYFIDKDGDVARTPLNRGKRL